MRVFIFIFSGIFSIGIASCAFFGPDRIGGKIICEISGETAETCYLDYQVDRVYQSTQLIDITKDFSREMKGVGTVLQAGDTYGITYIGNIVDCAKSSNIVNLSVTEAVVSEAREDFSEPYAMSPKEFAKFEAIRKLGPRFTDIKEVQVRFGQIIKAEINEEELADLLYKNLKNLPVICRSWLKEGTYIVTKTLMVDAFEYKFKGYFNKTIGVTEENLDQFVTFSRDLRYELTPQRTILVTDPHDIAIAGSIAVDYFGYEVEPLFDVLLRYYVYIEGYSIID